LHDFKVKIFMRLPFTSLILAYIDWQEKPISGLPFFGAMQWLVKMYILFQSIMIMKSLHT